MSPNSVILVENHLPMDCGGQRRFHELKQVSNEYVEFCFINWLLEFVQTYYRVSPTTSQERFPPRKQVRMVKVIHFSAVMSSQSSTWKMTTQIKLDMP